jgi:Fe-S cluster biogenesis protein NfuA
VELLAVEEGIARLRLTGSGQGCGSTAALETIEQAVQEAAPELSGLEVENAVGVSSAPATC